MFKENNTSISICILRLSSIGDITHILPIISTLQKNYKNCDITWIIGKTEYQLVKELDDINFVVIDKNKTIDSLLGMHIFSKKMKFDIVFHMQKSLRSKLAGKIIKGKINITFNDIDTQKSHVIEHFFSFLDKINIKSRVLDWKTEKILEKNDKYLTEINFNKPKTFVAINPFTSDRVNNYREWDYDNYSVISDYLKNKYSIDTVFLGKASTKKKSQLEEKLQNKSNIVNMINKTSLEEMLCILNICKFYIGPDSASLHMANMLKVPVIGLFATSNPKRTGPYNNLNFTVDKYEEALNKFSNKSIADAKWGERVREKDAMKLIKLDDVKKMIRKVLSR
tara:strand:- start:2363 stop:3376 length:1014 start_codon:yes stop_codon:yes gene_type:complete